MTVLVYRSDPYARSCEAKVLALTERGGIVLDRTVFYAAAGGQPGDSGHLELAHIGKLPITTTVLSDDKATVIHVPSSADRLPAPGEPVRAFLDWDIRHRLMRVHTSLHLLCALVRFPVTGGQIAAVGGRLDFDIPDVGAIDRERIAADLNRLIAENHTVSERWISDEELAARPELVRTMSVKPPAGTGTVRLVAIGQDGSVDLQPCGGTHVKSTGEIGAVSLGKIESKGKQNRRLRVLLD